MPFAALPDRCPALFIRPQVKGALKRAPPSAKVLRRCLDARQFGLKLIANVTYGYTAAGFSGEPRSAALAAYLPACLPASPAADAARKLHSACLP